MRGLPRSPRRTTESPVSRRPSRATIIRPARDGAAAARYRFVGGKGGAGKTTCAAGIAVAAAAAGGRVLLISTDPAPSLGDALARPLGAAPRAVAVRRGSLSAVEIDAPRALDRWLAGRREAFERIALRGTWLDQDDVSRLLRLSLPGIDELAALFEITRLAAAGRYDLIVVDTAPTGHTLRMLSMPETLRGIARVFDDMQARHRVLVDALRGGWTPDAEDRLIDEIDREGRDLTALLRDPARTRLSWVTLPEPMAVEETADAATALAAQAIPLHDVIVNRMTPEPGRRCGWCDARRVLERRAIRVLRARAPAIPLLAVASRDAEPRGVRALAGIGTELAAEAPVAGATRSRARTWRAALPGGAADDTLTLLTGRGTRLLLFGGKGGVGKTTCAAAAAMALASAEPRRRVLLLSTDPAHSLGDVFGALLSDVPQAVSGAPPNLAVRELDAAAGFHQVRERYAAAIEALFDRLSRGSAGGVGIDAGPDRRVMHGLIDLAPPGIDELAAVIDVTDALEGVDAGARLVLAGVDAGVSGARGVHAGVKDGLGEGRGRDDNQLLWDLVVMDTAPSGHALRLLEMPALVQDWARALMSILLKYQPVAGIGELGAVLLKLSQGLGRLRALLADPERTSFIAVTRAAALPREETLSLVARLRRMGVHVPAIVINAVGRGTCARCCRASASADREIVALRRAVRARRGSPLVVVTPAQIPPPHGAVALRRWQRTWRQSL